MLQQRGLGGGRQGGNRRNRRLNRRQQAKQEGGGGDDGGDDEESSWLDEISDWIINDSMASMTRSLKDILSIKIKARHDGYTDQFNRLFMTKIFIIASVVMGVDYFNDRVSCFTPEKWELSSEFVHAACWISGFFVYKELTDMTEQAELDQTIYYGIPHRLTDDGISNIKRTCQVHLARGKSRPPGQTCQAMTRVYYLQYQWMPFYIAALGILYYMPYIFFRIANTDLVSLKSVMKSAVVDPDDIVKNYFNYKVNPKTRLRIRIVLNIFVKIMYIAVNVLCFHFTDYLLYGKFASFGTKYMHWADNNATTLHHREYRKYPKPGNVLLPSMGICEIHKASAEETAAEFNRHLLLCDMSPNILYQYVLFVLWLMFVLSISISILGLLSHLSQHVATLLCISPKSRGKRQIVRVLTLRESEYLMYIRKKNLIVYGDVLRKLKQQRSDMVNVKETFETSNGFV